MSRPVSPSNALGQQPQWHPVVLPVAIVANECTWAAQAVMQLQRSAEGEDSVGDEWTVDVLLRRLADDDAGVVFAVLDSPLLMNIPATALSDGLSAALQRATAALQSGSGETSGLQGIARKVGWILALAASRMVS